MFSKGRSSEQSIELPQKVVYRSLTPSTPGTSQRRTHSGHRQQNSVKKNGTDLYYSADELDEDTDEFVML